MKVKVSKFVSADELQKTNEKKILDVEKLKNEKSNNWRERGLIDMMGGVLEAKQEDELNKVM